MLLPQDETRLQRLSRQIKETQHAIQSCVPFSDSHYTNQLAILDASLIMELQHQQSVKRQTSEVADERPIREIKITKIHHFQKEAK